MTNVTLQNLNGRVFFEGELPSALLNDIDPTQKLTDEQIQQLSLATQQWYDDLSAGLQQALGTLPTLPEAQGDASQLGGVALPSMGATVLSLITKSANEQRLAMTEQSIEANRNLIENMLKEVKELKSKARTQFALALTGAALQAAGSITTGIMAGKGFGMDEAQAQLQNTLAGAVGGAIGHGADFFKAGADFASTGSDAEIKGYQAEEERARNIKERLNSLDEALKQLIQKSLSTQDAIQQNINQTRSKILG